MVSTILCDYSEYDKYHRKGAGALFSYLSADRIEYLKTLARWVNGNDKLTSRDYIWKGQRSSIREILKKAAVILPNSASEYKRITQTYRCNTRYFIVPNGIDAHLFKRNCSAEKDPYMVLCVARIEGIKNQLNLIRALNDTKFNLVLIGSFAPNQKAYYDECRRVAAKNITFIDNVLQEQLVKYYQHAKVHVLPSWFETTGLSSLEAAVMGCNIVITDRGDAKEYFGSNAFYCNPSDPQSILSAVEKASRCRYNEDLYEMIMKRYTWKEAALQTLKAYQSITK
ncbi:MAG: glycosyltransferase family 4 protein [Bacteroidetes bacterium]|nr:glycosyltransferase family 4 protein [Bacteroidota bacterium]